MSEKQLIFIDDSGDPGFRLKSGSGRMFVIACIIFDNTYDAEYASAGIRALKQKLGWKQEREFKFHRANDSQKKAFFERVRSADFRIRAIVVDKLQIKKPALKNADSFYQDVIIEVLDRFEGMKNANVYVDGSVGRNYRNRSASKLRQSLNKDKKRIEKYKIEDSRDNNLIQLADMMAGAIRVKYDLDKYERVDFTVYLGDKIEEIYIYGG